VKLYVLRHADADSSAPSDELRALSPKGLDQTVRVAEFCKDRAQVPDVILHSPVRRARETAELFGQSVESHHLIEVTWLDCGMSPEVGLKELATYYEFPSVLLVGHEPDLSQLIATCLGLGDPRALHLRKASLACLELDTLTAGGGRLEWLLTAKLIKP